MLRPPFQVEAAKADAGTIANTGAAAGSTRDYFQLFRRIGCWLRRLCCLC